LDEDKGWNKGLGINLKGIEAISLYLIPCVESHFLSLKKQNSTPRIGDILIPWFYVSPNHFVGLYIPGVEDLFQIGDQVIKVEHLGSRSRILSWRIR